MKHGGDFGEYSVISASQETKHCDPVCLIQTPFRASARNSNYLFPVFWGPKPIFYPMFFLSRADATFLLTVGSFLLTEELFYLQLCLGAFFLTLRAFLLTVGDFVLTIEAFCLLWESASNKQLNGL